ncbi:hybrid sensor histidine kinase/response regulator [Euzebya pacifica]|uniref:hybrid sensor histidine kinase/response regulator n=1 Tax=Euzebya pacifica TaxID=1608957 RepID=UPI0030FA4604
MNRVIRRLLLVEDSPSDAVLITSLVEERSAWDVVHVTTNTAATAALENGSFDAVLLDLGLPDGEGLASVRAMRDSFDVPIIVLTARPEATWGTEVVRSGAQDFIAKDEADAAGLERALRYAVQRHAQVQQLGRAQRRLQRYARAVAHDVRTPIATIRGFAEMILVEEQTRGAADSRTVDYAGRIVSQSKRLLDMAADLLEDATDDTDAVVDMTAGARWVEELLGNRMDALGAQMTITRLPRLQGKRTVLRQVLLNLSSNVLDHAKGTDLEMRWSSMRRSDGGWDVILEDNGEDVPDALISLGQPLPVLPVEANATGHGIGLRVAAAGMAEHDGAVWLSRGRSGGLRVTLEFPESASTDPKPL